MATRTRSPFRFTPAVRDIVEHHKPDGTVVASRVDRIRGHRLAVTELVTSRDSVFIPFRWIDVSDVMAFDRVIGPAKFDVTPHDKPRPDRTVAHAPTVTGKLTNDGYVEYLCDGCGRKSWRRPDRSQTTCRRCTSNRKDAQS